MNKIILIGRLTKDPETRTTGNGIPVASFTLAVDRRYKNQNGERDTDFIRCIAWRKTAEIMQQYTRQGTKIAVEGSIQTRSWDDNDGKRHWATEVVVDTFEFVESKKTEEAQGGKGQNRADTGPNSYPSGNNGKSYTNSTNTAYGDPEAFDDTGLPWEIL